MRLVSYNMQYARGKDGRTDLERCMAEVDGADIVALQEVERFWPRSGMVDQPAEIGRLLPRHYWVYGPLFDVHLESGDRSGQGAIDNRRRQFGNMLLSRAPILSSRVFPLPKTYYPDRFNMHMGAVETVVDAVGGPLRIWCIHLGHVASPERLGQIRHLLELQARGVEERGAWSGPGLIRGDDWTGGGAAPPMPGSTVWLGDFNMSPESEEYRLITARRADGPELLDSWISAGNRPGEGVTYFDHPQAEEDCSGLRIDYGFISPDLAGQLKQVWVDHAAVGSDHQPIWLELER